nr:Gfo/Idh/MocA family oxidoreductase [Caldilineaceae bacterium]
AGVEVVAIAARDHARAQAFARRHGLPLVLPSYADLLAEPGIDAIYNPLPNSLHAEWTIRALDAGKHVLCEKPLASNAAEAERMMQAAQSNRRLLFEAFHYRYHPLARRVKQIVESGELGRVRHLEANFCVPLLRFGDIRYRYELGGGAMMDLGCYVVHMLRQLAGSEPEVVQAEAHTASPQVDRWMRAELRFPGKLTASLTVSFWSLLPRVNLAVQGEKGELSVVNPVLPHLFHRLTVRSAAGKRSERAPGESTYTHQLRAFVDLVRGGQTPPASAADAIANMRVIDAVYTRAGLPLRGMVDG